VALVLFGEEKEKEHFLIRGEAERKESTFYDSKERGISKKRLGSRRVSSTRGRKVISSSEGRGGVFKRERQYLYHPLKKEKSFLYISREKRTASG